MNLSPEMKKAMRLVSQGADVSDPVVGRLLRQLEQEHPSLITIVAPMGNYDGRGRVPYFGAILTPAGRKAIRSKATMVVSR